MISSPNEKFNLFIIFLNFTQKINYFILANMKYYYSIYIIRLITNRLSSLVLIRSTPSMWDALLQHQRLQEYVWSLMKQNRPCPFKNKSTQHWTIAALCQIELVSLIGPDYFTIECHLKLNDRCDAFISKVSDSEYILHHG